jgi:hypothetical protein
MTGTWPGTRLRAIVAAMEPERRGVALAVPGIVAAIHGGRRGGPALKARVEARISARNAARREKRAAS